MHIAGTLGSLYIETHENLLMTGEAHSPFKSFPPTCPCATDTCALNLAIIDSDNGVSPVQHQAIIQTKTNIARHSVHIIVFIETIDDFPSITPEGTDFREGI